MFCHQITAKLTCYISPNRTYFERIFQCAGEAPPIFINDNDFDDGVTQADRNQGQNTGITFLGLLKNK